MARRVVLDDGRVTTRAAQRDFRFLATLRVRNVLGNTFTYVCNRFSVMWQSYFIELSMFSILRAMNEWNCVQVIVFDRIIAVFKTPVECRGTVQKRQSLQNLISNVFIIENPYLPWAFNCRTLLFAPSVYKSKSTDRTDALYTKTVLPALVHLTYPITGNSEHQFRRDHTRDYSAKRSESHRIEKNVKKRHTASFTTVKAPTDGHEQDCGFNAFACFSYYFV